MITRQLLPTRQLAAISQSSARLFSTSPAPQNAPSATPAAKPHTIDPRWLTTVKARVGKCLTSRPRPEQVQDAGRILQQLASDWRELVAGSEGYLTGQKNRGLFRQNVAWGEMVWLEANCFPD
ncbi:hypothetical protein PHISP_04121 [Aspergillus sp. HF37]|nr:hypothetical protein PHISP_04121 [Aspergillus sp. HF37]